MDTYFDPHINQVIEALTKIDHRELQRVEDILGYVRSEGGRVWLAGNGGSSATASHFTNDLVKMCGIQAFCLSDMTPLATAFGNDDGWENMYSSLVNKLEDTIDAVIGITCSGNSKNIVEFLENSAATWKIVLTGGNFESAVSKMISLDAILRAEHPDIRVQEDVHSVLCHALARRLSCR
jgi:D-sedoheptulose 7-phosphate isomerase